MPNLFLFRFSFSTRTSTNQCYGVNSPPKPMASVCISNCVNNTHLPIRPTYANLYGWPESDAEFMKKVCCNVSMDPHSQPRIVDSLSGRQIYLRSYTFSKKKEGVAGKIRSRIRHTVVSGCGRIRSYCKALKEYLMIRRVKDTFYAALFSMFRWLLSCFAKVHTWLWLIIVQIYSIGLPLQLAY